MRKRFAIFFASLAKRLNPDVDYGCVTKYKPNKIGMTYVINKNDVNDYRVKDGKKQSLTKARQDVIKEAKARIRGNIIAYLDKHDMFDFKVEKVGRGYEVSGQLKVYLMVEETDGQAQGDKQQS